jgi:molecular chaperone HtpG
MPADQTDIHYLTGDHRPTLEHAPSLEVFRHRGWDVLLLTDPIDEFVIPALPEYKGKHLKAADKSQPELKPEEQKQVEEAEGRFKPLLTALAPQIEDVQEIRLSRRMKESAACLVSEEGALGANLERLMQKLGKTEGMEAGKRILELNPEHAVVRGMLQLFEKNPADARIANYGRLLYEQAVISEGSRLQDPSAFIRRINELMAKDAGA